MKNTRKLLAAVMALTMVSAIAPMSAFAINQDDVTAGNNTGTMTATYDVTAKYTVTIPPSAVIADTEAAATAQPIKAENVLLASGEKVVVTLSEASNTTTANSTIFNAKKGDSTVKYTIKAGSDTVALGGKVAEFESKAAEQKVDVKFIKDSTSAPTVAGEHTETLTFGIAVTEAETFKTATVLGVEIKYNDDDKWSDIADKNANVTIYYGYVMLDGEYIILGGNFVKGDHIFDPNGNYETPMY